MSVVGISSVKPIPERVATERFKNAIAKSEGRAAETLKETRWKYKIEKERPSLFKQYGHNVYVQSCAIYLFAIILLILLSPPIVCYENKFDELDTFKWCIWKVIIVATIAPVAFLVIPQLSE